MEHTDVSSIPPSGNHNRTDDKPVEMRLPLGDPFRAVNSYCGNLPYDVGTDVVDLVGAYIVKMLRALLVGSPQCLVVIACIIY